VAEYDDRPTGKDTGVKLSEGHAVAEPDNVTTTLLFKRESKGVREMLKVMTEPTITGPPNACDAEPIEGARSLEVETKTLAKVAA
jgi:hypothetical protein